MRHGIKTGAALVTIGYAAASTAFGLARGGVHGPPPVVVGVAAGGLTCAGAFILAAGLTRAVRDSTQGKRQKT